MGGTRTKYGPPPPQTGTVDNVPPTNNGWAEPAPAVCEQMCFGAAYKPVCTIYDNEYPNDCYRECNGEPIQCENSCPCQVEAPATIVPDPCDYCMLEGFDPVCVEDEKQLQNDCVAKCKGKKIVCSSPCPC